MSAGATHRGRILLEQKRYADAEKYFREGLASDPNDAEAFYFLAVCQLNQDRPKEALETVERALEFSPEASEFHALRSLILSDLERSREALAAAEEAIRLDPDSDFGFVAQAAAHLRRQNWSAAETSARRALELNPENSSAANQLAQALRLQNRLQESAEQTEYMLSQDAEDADTHATAGWVALQRSDHRKAEEHFLEALRLEPTNTNARSGLKESYKARSPFYRVYLKYCFFLLRFTEAQRWALVIGLLIAVRVGRKILPGPLSMTLLAAYLLFVLWAHVASPVGNFQLLLDRAARHALSRGEKWEAIFSGGGVLLGIPLLVLGLLLGPVFLILGITLIGGAFPAAYTFVNKKTVGRILFASIGVVVYVAGLLEILQTASGQRLGAWVGGLTGLAAIGVIAVTWLSGISALHQREH